MTNIFNVLIFWCSTAPGKPCIIPDDCSAENNSVTIAWQPHLGNVAESYSLELDDGSGGDFRVSDVNVNFARQPHLGNITEHGSVELDDGSGGDISVSVA